MATDFTQSPPQILVDLINLTNGIFLRLADITYGPVTALTGGNRNSGITVTAAPGSPYTGYRDLTYNRVHFTEIIGTRSTEFERGNATFIAHLIPQINMAYAINLQPEDYYNDPLPPPDSGEYTSDKRFTLRAREGSYVWRGTAELTLRGNKTPLTAILGVSVLSGFNLPRKDLSELLMTVHLNGFYYNRPMPIAVKPSLTTYGLTPQVQA